jgi:hypothetical protein
MGAHEPPAGDGYWTRPHPEPVVLDIGGEVGALILYAPPELHGREIEVSRAGRSARVHAAVLERRIGGRTVFAAVYPGLDAGTYDVWRGPTSSAARVTVPAAGVAELDWR